LIRAFHDIKNGHSKAREVTCCGPFVDADFTGNDFSCSR
jgi:hypothetical protein